MTFRRDLSIPEAIVLVQEQAKPLGSEEVGLLEAYGRTLAEDLVSLVDHPSADNSALDGYACREVDTLSASDETPVRLRVVGEVQAGRVYAGEVGPGAAVSITTGAPTPKGADAIVMVEKTERRGDEVLVFHPASPSDVRPRAQDLRTGARYLRAGQKLSPAAVGVAASMGYARLEVIRQPRVAILSTGDEVKEPGTPIAPGQLYNSNAYSVAGLVLAAGGVPLVLPKANDDKGALRDALEGLGDVDLLVTSGGVSMGKYDFIRDLLIEEGTVHFWKVAVRPGGPAMFGEWRGLPVFGLPGNPVSSMVIFLLVAQAWLHRALGSTEALPFERRVTATAEDTFKGAGYKTAFRRARLLFDPERGYRAHSTGEQGSGLLTSMLYADALAIVPPHQDVEVGERLEVISL
ncbi:MAG: molybdopterin molybdotransferase MoeA [Deinococcota bacterium]|jgi:molybdopterin molybdotransferase|nr:molybdopterin molybdotransferase MoeA [Deinococcota bacterium]